MKRKIVKQGKATMTISLPSKWIRNNNLKNGDEINLEEKDNTIIIAGQKADFNQSTKIDLRNKSKRSVRWTLSSLHKKGFDEIEIIYDDDFTLKIIETELKELLTGFVVIEQSSKRCVIKSLSKENQEEFDNILRRTFLVTLSLAENTFELSSKNNFKELSSLLSLEKTNNQLTNFCERLINKGLYDNPKKSYFLYVICWNLEKLCDEYKYICTTLITKNKIEKNELKKLKKTNDLFRSYYELFFKFDFENLNQLNIRANKILENEKNLSQIEHNLNNIIVKIKDFSASTIALNI